MTRSGQLLQSSSQSAGLCADAAHVMQRLFQDAFLAQYYSPEPTGDPSIAIDYKGEFAQTFDARCGLSGCSAA